MTLSASEIESIASLTAKKLCESDQPFYVPKEDHYHDHLLIKQMRANSEEWSGALAFIAGERRTRERRQNDARKIRNQVFGALMTAGVLGMLGLLGAWGISALANLIKTQGG
tara:strand:- start:2483 stop:2818 length:336 start_codon:yes stop_codon:yes gene_type:complete